MPLDRWFARPGPYTTRRARLPIGGQLGRNRGMEGSDFPIASNLAAAILTGDVARVEALLAGGANPKAHIHLRRAVSTGNPVILQRLIDHGADLRVNDYALGAIAVRDANREITEVLLAADFQPGALAAPAVSYALTEEGMGYAQWLIPRIVADPVARNTLMRELENFNYQDLVTRLFEHINPEQAEELPPRLRREFDAWVPGAIERAIAPAAAEVSEASTPIEASTDSGLGL